MLSLKILFIHATNDLLDRLFNKGWNTRTKLVIMTVDLYANEVVIKAGDTTKVVDKNKVPGKLIITNQRVYFKAIEQVNESHNLEILPETIEEVIYFGGMFSSKGLNLITSDGFTHSFPLKKRDEIGRLINSMY